MPRALSVFRSISLIFLASLLMRPDALEAQSSWTPTGNLNASRWNTTATVLLSGQVLAVGGQNGQGWRSDAEIYDPTTGRWTITGSLKTGRASHTATLLPSGKVLIVGGYVGETSVTDSVEIYDPQSGEFEVVADLNTGRRHHTATLLPTGDVLIAGGVGVENNGFISLSSAEIYRVADDRWDEPDPMASNRHFHFAVLLGTGEVLVGSGTLNPSEIFDPVAEQWRSLDETFPSSGVSATLLHSGEVLVAGGRQGGTQNINFENATKIFNPESEMWRPGPPLAQARAGHGATLLPSGKVLVTAGLGPELAVLAKTEIYDPDSETWEDSSPLQAARINFPSVLLPSGKAMALGGLSADSEHFSAEVFDEDAGHWHLRNDLNIGREGPTLSVLPKGEILAIGGATASGVTNIVEISYDEAMTWELAEPLGIGRQGHSATVLPTGEVLVLGGFNGSALKSAEIYSPGEGFRATAHEMHTARGHHSATLLSSGKVLIVGGYNEGALAAVEIFNPSTEEFTMVEGLSVARYFQSATLLTSGEVLVVGGRATNSIDDNLWQVEIFNPRSGSWRPAQNLSTGRARHSATLLPSGDVLVAAGRGNSATSSAEIFDAERGQWSTTGFLTDRREGHHAILLPSGQVLVVGGTIEQTSVATFEVYSPESGLWHTPFGSSPMLAARGNAATLLPSGDVLLAGGFEGEFQKRTLAFSFPGAPSGQRPEILSASETIRFGENLQVNGNFRGLSEASSGSTRSSATNYPITLLRSLDGQRHYRLTPDPRLEPGANFWDEPSTLDFSQLPAALEPGPHLLSVTVAGQTSDPILIDVECSLSIDGPISLSVIGSDNSLPEIGQAVTLSVETQGARRWQWQKNGIDIPGATGKTYVSEPISAEDVGTEYRVKAENDCTEEISAPLDLPIVDAIPPSVRLIEPTGGEFWPLSVNGDMPNIENVIWEASDNIRICQVRIELLYSIDGGMNYHLVEGSGEEGTLPITYGPGGVCSHDQRVIESSTPYHVPMTPPSGVAGSLYKIRVIALDQNNQEGEAESEYPFYFVVPSSNFKTLILHHPRRLEDFGSGPLQDLNHALGALAHHETVLGQVVDLTEQPALNLLYDQWDDEPENPIRANEVLFGPGGLHEVIRNLLQVYPGVTSIVLVGGDSIVPMARIKDRTTLFSEKNYTHPDSGDLTASGTRVGAALDSDFYLSDDPLAVLDDVIVDDLNTSLFIPDIAIGRLVETPEEMLKTISTYLSHEGILDLSAIDDETGHKVQVAGYDFLQDSANRIAKRWKTLLGGTGGVDDVEPTDAVLIGQDWNQMDLSEHLCGNGGESYSLISLNGHATHYLEGVPGNGQHDITGLSADELRSPTVCSESPLDLSGSVIFSVGCHSGLPVDGSGTDPLDLDHSLDLPQTFLSRGAVVYTANSGYGWGLKVGVGYSERLVEIFNQEIIQGHGSSGSVSIGEMVRNAKRRYLTEARYPDVYDEKTLMQWTTFGLPMYRITSGIELPEVPVLFEGEPRAQKAALEIEEFEGVIVERQLHKSSAPDVLPQFLTPLRLSFRFEGDVYQKFNAAGDDLPADGGCPAPSTGNPEGCFHSLNEQTGHAGIVDHPIQPYFVYDSRLSGTSQHGVLWLGGEFSEQDGWVPIIAELVSNGGDGSNHGVAPRLRRILPTANGFILGEDPPNCRTSDLEINSIVVTVEEVLKENFSDSVYDTVRIDHEVDLEAFYYNNQEDSDKNCDRNGPAMSPGHGESFHKVAATTVDWAVSAVDREDGEDGVWRVLVVYTDNIVDTEGRGRWTPLELTKQDGLWRGSVNVGGPARLTYVLQAVDKKGNVSWIEFTSPETEPEPPASGVPLSLPETVDVSIQLEDTDLRLEMVDVSDPVLVNNPVIYELSVSNDGTEPASSIKVTHLLPTSTTFINAGSGGWDCYQGQDQDPMIVICEMDFLAAGETAAPIHVVLIAPPSPGLLSSSATVEALQNDPDATNNVADETTSVVALADLRVDIDNGQSQVTTGELVTYDLALVHLGGGADVTEVTLDITRPEGICDVQFEPRPGQAFDEESGLWSGLGLGDGEATGMSIHGVICAQGVGRLTTSVWVNTPDGIADPNLSNNSAEDTDDIVDEHPPEVLFFHSVSATDEGELSYGEWTEAALTQLLITFTESVEGMGDASNYLLVALGDDDLLSTASCAQGAQGDDVEVMLDPIVFGDREVALRVADGRPIGNDIHILFVCNGLEDAAGNALVLEDLAFRVAVKHLLVDPNFDQDLTAWQAITPPMATVLHDEEDHDGAVTSGSARLLAEGDSGPAGIRQCVPLTGINAVIAGGAIKISADTNLEQISTTLAAFADAGCQGEQLSNAVSDDVFEERDLWLEMPRVQLGDLSGAASVLVSFQALGADTGTIEVRFDNLYLEEAEVFADGFESGDSSRWTNQVP